MMTDLLSQDEIDALLHGVDSGAVETEPPPAPGEARSYDFASQDRIVRGKLPTLEMINERFARTWRVGLFNLLRRSADLSVRGIDLLRFGEYMHSLQVPTNLNLVKMKPLRGTAIVTFEPGDHRLRVVISGEAEGGSSDEVTFGYVLVDEADVTRVPIGQVLVEAAQAGGEARHHAGADPSPPGDRGDQQVRSIGLHQRVHSRTAGLGSHAHQQRECGIGVCPRLRERGLGEQSTRECGRWLRRYQLDGSKRRVRRQLGHRGLHLPDQAARASLTPISSSTWPTAATAPCISAAPRWPMQPMRKLGATVSLPG